MTHRSVLLFAFGLVLSLAPVWSAEPRVALTVAEADEAEALTLLASHEVHALSWSNALVEVSAFEGLELVPVATLDRRLTPQDPRWDPWLHSVGASFAPRSGAVRLWIAPEQVTEARAALAGLLLDDKKALRRPAESPASITGWTLIAGAFLALVLFVVAGVLGGWPAWNEPRRWLWAPLSGAALVVGILLLGPASSATSVAAGSSVSWLQHRWFQEAWPWGAKWDDYAPDRAWSFRSYEHREGKLTEVEATLAAADRGWAESALDGLDAHHAQRIFGTGNP